MRKKLINRGGKKGRSYVKCWQYLEKNKIYFLIISLIFLISLIIGFFFPVFLVDIIEKFLKELVEKTTGMNFFQLLIFIFQNNLLTAFVGLLFGIFLGLFPLLLSSLNGYVLGFVFERTVKVGGYGVLWRIFPHGIFELPALIISLGLGLRLGMSIFSRKKDIKKELLYNLESSLRVFLFIVLPLLLIAAIIESALIFLLS